jgi:hypothetical protein
VAYYHYTNPARMRTLQLPIVYSTAPILEQGLERSEHRTSKRKPGCEEEYATCP